MLIFRHSSDLTRYLRAKKSKSYIVGFVPTMGALHNGHISLIHRSKDEANLTVCSIFVNPTQFNDPSDFEKYPVSVERDIEMLTDAKCDVLFLPSVLEMYPRGTRQANKIDFGFLAQTLEGEYRPGHFDGMAQIVERLLRVVQPDVLFMGQKDYQQQLIVKELIKRKGLGVLLRLVPTLREKDGLAMSSRNVRLDEESRRLAKEISKTLKAVKAKIRNMKPLSSEKIQQVEQWGLAQLKAKRGVLPEYFQIRNAGTLQKVKKPNEKLVALAAAQIGNVRLIDNMLLN